MFRALVLALALVPLSGAAQAAPPSGLGTEFCQLTSMTDPNPEAPEGSHRGWLEAGPFLESGTVNCTIQVGGAGHHDGDDVVVSARGTLVTYLPPTPVSYYAPPLVPVFVCTEFIAADGTMWFWDGSEWGTDSDTLCGPAISGGTGR